MRVVFAIILVALSVAAGCKKDPMPGPTPGPSTPAATKDDVMVPRDEGFQEPLQSHLLLSRSDTSAVEASFLAVKLGPTLAVGPRYSVPAAPLAQVPGRFRAIASVSGSTAVHAVRKGTSWQIERRTLEKGENPPAIDLVVDDVSALLAVGPMVLVGGGTRVGIVDTRAAEPSFRKLAAREAMGWKAYDLFARDGALVVAIDDVVSPIWAELLSLEDGGKHVAPYTMPSFINGTYAAAALRVNDVENRNGSLFAFGRYGILDGHGHDLTRLEIRSGKLEVKDGVVLNSTPMSDPPVLEEHVSRDTGKPEKLVAGTEVTPWTGMALYPGTGQVEVVLLAAGTRGLLAVPASFGPSTKAEVALAGQVSDVLVVGAVAYVLVQQPDATELVGLERRADGYAETGPRLRLPEVFDRFVR